MDLSLRIASIEDADAVAALVNSAYRGESSQRGWTSEAHLLGGQRTDADLLREQIANPSNAILLFHTPDELIASVFLQRRGTSAYLGMLTVRPDRQTMGIGKRILSVVEAWVRETWSAEQIEMTVIEKRQELIAWYKRRGFSETGAREAFPYHDSRVGLPKVHDLDMVVLAKRL